MSEEGLPDMVVCYLDATVAMPILTAYVLENCPRRPLKRLYDRRDAMVKALRDAALAARSKRKGA